MRLCAIQMRQMALIRRTTPRPRPTRPARQRNPMFSTSTNFPEITTIKIVWRSFLGLQQVIREFVSSGRDVRVCRPCLRAMLANGLFNSRSYGKVIISECMKDEEEKQSSQYPRKARSGRWRQITGSRRPIQVCLRCSTNGRWIYGGKIRDDELAMKSVSHEPGASSGPPHSAKRHLPVL